MKRKGQLFFYIWILYYIYSILSSIAFEAGSFITIIVHFALLSYLCYYNFLRNEFWNSFDYIYLYILFLLILVILSSSQYFVSFRMLIKYSEQLLCLPIAFGLFGESNNVNKVWLTLKIMLILFLLNFFFANLFNLGGAIYADVEGADIGNLAALDDFHYINACFMCVIPIFLRNEYRFKLFWQLAAIFAFILVVSSIKRVSILCMIIPIVTSLIYQVVFRIRYKNSEHNIITANSLFIYIASVLFIIFLSLSFKHVIEKRIEVRMERFENGFAKEGRTRELMFICDDILVKSDISTFLFGKETFNTVGTYANGIFGKRMIHENYGIILNGTGIVGLLVHILINMYIILLFIRYVKRVDLASNLTARKFYVCFISLWIIYFVSSLSGNIWCVLYPSMHYSLTGLILRYFYEYGETYNPLYLKDIESD